MNLLKRLAKFAAPIGVQIQDFENGTVYVYPKKQASFKAKLAVSGDRFKFDIIKLPRLNNAELKFAISWQLAASLNLHPKEFIFKYKVLPYKDQSTLLVLCMTVEKKYFLKGFKRVLKEKIIIKNPVFLPEILIALCVSDNDSLDDQMILSKVNNECILIFTKNRQIYYLRKFNVEHEKISKIVENILQTISFYNKSIYNFNPKRLLAAPGFELTNLELSDLSNGLGLPVKVIDSWKTQTTYDLIYALGASKC